MKATSKMALTMVAGFALGATAYGFFLHQVALLPYTPEQLLAMARQDFDRVLAMEAYERQVCRESKFVIAVSNVDAARMHTMFGIDFPGPAAFSTCSIN